MTGKQKKTRRISESFEVLRYRDFTPAMDAAQRARRLDDWTHAVRLACE